MIKRQKNTRTEYRFRKICRRCNEMFVPKGKYSYYCQNCLLQIRKENSEKSKKTNGRKHTKSISWRVETCTCGHKIYCHLKSLVSSTRPTRCRVEGCKCRKYEKK